MNSNRSLRITGALTVGLLAASLFAGLARAQSADPRNFKVVNETGQQIDHLYVSPHESRYWGPDVLGYDVLSDDTETTIVFRPDWRTSCSMDFMLVLDDRSVQTYTKGINVCVLNGVVFYPSSLKGI